CWVRVRPRLRTLTVISHTSLLASASTVEARSTVKPVWFDSIGAPFFSLRLVLAERSISAMVPGDSQRVWAKVLYLAAQLTAAEAGAARAARAVAAATSTARRRNMAISSNAMGAPTLHRGRGGVTRGVGARLTGREGILRGAGFWGGGGAARGRPLPSFAGWRRCGSLQARPEGAGGGGFGLVLDRRDGRHTVAVVAGAGG